MEIILPPQKEKSIEDRLIELVEEYNGYEYDMLTDTIWKRMKHIEYEVLYLTDVAEELKEKYLFDGMNEFNNHKLYEFIQRYSHSFINMDGWLIAVYETKKVERRNYPDL